MIVTETLNPHASAAGIAVICVDWFATAPRLCSGKYHG